MGGMFFLRQGTDDYVLTSKIFPFYCTLTTSYLCIRHTSDRPESWKAQVRARHDGSVRKEPHYPERELPVALLPVVGQDAMIPVGDNDTSTPVARISDGKMHTHV